MKFRKEKTKKKKKNSVVSEKIGYFQNGAKKERFSNELSFLNTSNILFLSVMPHLFTMQLFY